MEAVPAHRPHEGDGDGLGVEADVHVRQAQLLVGLGDLVRHAADVEQVDAALQERERRGGGLRLGRGRHGRLLRRRLAGQRAGAGDHGRRGVVRGDLAGALVFVFLSGEHLVRGDVDGLRVLEHGRRDGRWLDGFRRPALRRLRRATAAPSTRRDDGRLDTATRPLSAAGPSSDLLRLRLSGLGLAQRRHLGGELGRRLAPGALAGFGRVAGERAGLRLLLGGCRRRAKRPASSCRSASARASSALRVSIWASLSLSACQKASLSACVSRAGASAGAGAGRSS